MRSLITCQLNRNRLWPSGAPGTVCGCAAERVARCPDSEPARTILAVVRKSVLSLALLITACSPRQSDLLGGVQASAPTLSPDVRDARNRLDIKYTLSSPAQLSAYIEAPDGRRWTVYEEQERPLKGEYRLAFDGTVPGPRPNERRVLPDGEYRVLLQAETNGAREQAVVPVSIKDADSTPPVIEELTLFPDRISPDFDADADITRISYRLSKAGRTTPFADRVLPDGHRQRAWTGEERNIEAGEQHLRWDGTVNSRPVPEGEYEFGIRAEDHAGNVSEERRKLTVEASGLPEAKIVWARISPHQVIRGGQVCLDAVVRNTGQTVLRSQKPDPGFLYNSFDTYSSVEQHAHVEHAGYWRVGLDWAGLGSAIGAKYPWRWGFGKDLAPGEEVPIHGCVRAEHEQTKMVFFAALIQENVAIHDSGIGMVEVRLSP
jgi:hypothetical protein